MAEAHETHGMVARREEDIGPQDGVGSVGMGEFFDMFGDGFFDIDLGGGKKAVVEDERAKRYLAQQRRAAQAEYEGELLREVRKLQQLAKLESISRKQAEQAELESRERELRRRKEEEVRRRKALEKEALAEELERSQEHEFARKQREAEARTAEIERQKLAVVQRERNNRLIALQVAREKQEAIAAKAIRDKERQAAIKAKLDEQKRAALLARLEERRHERIEASERKAQVSAQRIYRSFQLRSAAADDMQQAYVHKHQLQEERLSELQHQKELRQVESKERAIQKRLFMEKVASRQQEREEAFKASVEQKHSSKAEQQRATEKARAREAEARQYERMAQQYEARERVLGALKGRQRHLEALEARWAEKDQRTDTLLREREKAALSRRSLFGMLARERQAVLNAMQESKVTKRFTLPLHIRSNISDPTLKTVLDRADPQQTGVITLNKLNDVLSEMDPALFAQGSPPARRHDDGASHSGALTGDELTRSRRIFQRIDRNADGEIEFAEFCQVVAKIMRQRGVPTHSEQWLRSAFDSVDRDRNGQIDFDEFVEAHNTLEAGGQLQSSATAVEAAMAAAAARAAAAEEK